MNEKNLRVLEQYDLEVRNVRRGRGCYCLETDKGLVLLKEYQGSKLRAEWMHKVCQTLLDEGLFVELLIANREGEYISCDRDDNRYIIKSWCHGREIDVKNAAEVCEAVVNLARLHEVLQGFEGKDFKEYIGLEKTFEKRMRELRKVYRYVTDKKRKNTFEMDFLKEYYTFFEQCEQAEQMMCSERMQILQTRLLESGSVCHGDYHQHNVLKEEESLFTANFESCRIGMQTEDLYNFMRKMLEKHNWNLSLAEKMLCGYLRQRDLSQGELEQLYIQFLFSEKFWKIVNHYYNSKKTWIPDRSQQKLDKLVQQSAGKKEFLDYFWKNYL